MEKVSILALSFILTTSFSISSAQSAMFAYYKGIPHSMIELLVSLPSAGIMVSLIFNKWIGRLFSERQMIVIGLVAYALCGFIPLISPAYPVVFLSRIIFGMAVGLLNVSAIAIISERYKGKERVQTLGIRGFCRGCWDSCFDLWSESLDSLWLAGCLSRLRYQYSNLTFVSLICAI